MRTMPAALAVLTILTGAASAEVISYGTFIYNTEFAADLLMQGEITDTSVYDFRKALREHPVKTLYLDSPGGSVYAGLEISAIIRDKGLGTVIPEDAMCASACSFLFVAGVSRQAYGTLGVHQFASDNDTAPAPEGDTQFVTSEIIDFLKEYDIPMIFMVRMLETPNTSMYWFPQDELLREGLVDEGKLGDATKAAVGPDAGPAAEPLFTPGVSPSFDCAAASTPTETAICQDPALARSDRDLSAKFGIALRGRTDASKKELRAQQKVWLAARDACGAERTCISDEYSARLSALDVWMTN